MRDAHRLLRRHQGAGHRRIDVAVDHHPVRRQTVQHGLELRHDPGGLDRVAPGSHAEIDIRSRQAEVCEEPITHRRVVVLAGVYQVLAHARNGCAGPEHRRHLHEIGSRPNDVKQSRHSRSEASGRSISKKNRVPDSAVVSTLSVACIASTSLRQMESPRPDPRRRSLACSLAAAERLEHHQHRLAEECPARCHGR